VKRSRKRKRKLVGGEKVLSKGEWGGIRGTGMSHGGSLPIVDNAFIYNWLVRAVEANM
jgi:hypothetical protein